MFKGVFTALITPFQKDGSIDRGALTNLIKTQLANNISGLVPMGTTGESPTLSHAEHIEAIKLVMDETQGKVPVIAGTGSNCTDEAISLTQRAKDIGVTASLQVAPYYNKPTQEGFYQHFMKIADSVDMPLIVYNIPGRSGKNIENSTMLKLAQHPNIVGVKEASGDFSQVMDLLASKPADFCLLSGDDNLVYPMIALGASGIISVASNLIPSKMMEFVTAALEGNFAKAKEMHYQLMPLFKSMFLETNPIPVKAALVMMGKVQEYYRLPMCPPSAENKEKLKAALKDAGLI